MDRLVTAGRVGKLFGVKGELMITLYDVFPRDFKTEEPVFVKIDSHTVPLFFDRFQRRGQKGATVVFADINTENRASELIGLEFSLRMNEEKAVVKIKTELYPGNFVGWKAESETDSIGKITAFIDSDFNPLFEIEISGECVLIPASDDFIVGFDEKQRKVIFSLPEGLLDINK